MNKKFRKTLYLPQWLGDILDAEGESYDGPGVVAAAAIYYFSTRKTKEKVNMLRDFRAHEILSAYSDEADAESKSKSPQRTQKKHGRTKLG